MLYMPRPRPLMACTLALAVISGASTISVAIPQTVAIASEPTIDAMVEGYYHTPASDGNKYSNSIATFAYISKKRHMYHSAARDQHYDNFYTSRDKAIALTEIHHRSERACFIGKARVVLSLLQSEGNKLARAIDISQVGIDLKTSKQALPLLTESIASHTVLHSNETDPQKKKAIEKRIKLSEEGKSALTDIINDLESNNDTYEYDAFSVINWGVSSEILHKNHHVHVMPVNVPELEIFSASVDSKTDKIEVEKSARKNRLAMAATLPMPEPVNTANAQSTGWKYAITFFKYFGIIAGLISLIVSFLPR